MDICVVDKVIERYDPPHRQAIEDARLRQMAAIKALRRLLADARPGKYRG